MKRGRPGDWHIPGANCSKKCERLQPFSSVVMKTTAVLCVRRRSTIHSSIISPAEKYNRTIYLPRGPVHSIYMRGALWCFHPNYMRLLENSHKQETNLKTVQFLAKEVIRPQTLERGWRQLTINTLSLDASMMFSSGAMSIAHTCT